MIKYRLMTPGPTPVPEETLLAMARPIIHHRKREFEAVMEEVKGGLKELFMTKNDVLIIASSGTGCMEGAVSNFLSKGDKAIVVRGGKFGERWGEICEAYGVKTINVDVEWGRPVDPQVIADILRREGDVRAVYTQASETSTCTAHPIRELGAIVKDYEDCILVVDAITGIGVFPILTDEWGLDVVVAGSQKALMLPPGLAFISISDKAWRQGDRADLPRYYFDLRKERKNLAKNTTAYTPAVSLVIGLQDTLAKIKAEGLENLFARVDRLARATRAALTAIGLELLAKESPSNACTGAFVPNGIDADKLIDTLSEKYNITVAEGQGHLKGKIFRIAHMGYIDAFDVLATISAIESTLSEMGHSVELGKGVRAAQEILWEK